MELNFGFPYFTLQFLTVMFFFAWEQTWNFPYLGFCVPLETLPFTYTHLADGQQKILRVQINTLVSIE